MKRTLVLLACIVLLGSTIAFPVEAAETDGGIRDQIIISQTVEDLGNGCFYIETISVPSIQLYSSTRTGTKSSVYVVSGTSIFSISVTGTFIFDGSTAEATSASGSVVTYVEGVTINSRSAYTSGASAYATTSVTYNGATLQKTVKLTCDKDGNLS